MEGSTHVYLLGALAREPELRYSPDGAPILELTVAGEDEVLASGGELKTLPWYHRAKLFGKAAERLAELPAGTGLLVEGSLRYSAWEGEGGEKRSRLEMVALRVEEAPLGREHLVEDRGGGLRRAGGLNQVVLVGTLTREPEVRHTTSNDAVASLPLAVNEAYRSRSGETVERTHFVEVTAWRELAGAAEGAGKGDPVFVAGRLVSSSWEDGEGRKRYALKVQASRLERLVRPPAKDEGATGQGRGRDRRSAPPSARSAPGQGRDRRPVGSR